MRREGSHEVCIFKHSFTLGCWWSICSGAWEDNVGCVAEFCPLQASKLEKVQGSYLWLRWLAAPGACTCSPSPARTLRQRRGLLSKSCQCLPQESSVSRSLIDFMFLFKKIWDGFTSPLTNGFISTSSKWIWVHFKKLLENGIRRFLFWCKKFF